MASAMETPRMRSSSAHTARTMNGRPRPPLKQFSSASQLGGSSSLSTGSIAGSSASRASSRALKWRSKVPGPDSEPAFRIPFATKRRLFQTEREARGFLAARMAVSPRAGTSRPRTNLGLFQGRREAMEATGHRACWGPKEGATLVMEEPSVSVSRRPLPLTISAIDWLKS